jgi:putative transposase
MSPTGYPATRAPWSGQRMPRADHPDTAPAQLEALARELERTHPGAAGSLREGLQETLTVLRLNVPPSLARTLRSTTAIESMISIARTHSRNVNNPAEREHGAAGSAASRVTSTWQHCEPPSMSMSPPRLSVPSAMMNP